MATGRFQDLRRPGVARVDLDRPEKAFAVQNVVDTEEPCQMKPVDQPPAEPISALAYLQESGLEWADEIWLFQVIAEYQGLPRSEQQAFRLQQEESKASAFNDLRLIHDVALAVAV
mgnify:CR=1 FL=1